MRSRSPRDCGDDSSSEGTRSASSSCALTNEMDSPNSSGIGCARLEVHFLTNRREGESVMKVTTVGLDLAKNVCAVHGVDEQGKVVLRRQVSRGRLLELFAQLPQCRVGVEACSGAHYWARELERL